MLLRVYARMAVALALTAWLAAPTHVAHALPTSGTYIIDAAQSNGLSGWFTVNSTATALQDWLFTSAGVNWTSSDIIVTNHTITLNVFDLSTGKVLDIQWFQSVWAEYFNDQTDPVIYNSFQYTPQSVPEPSSAALLLAGLGLLVGYGVRQRRQTGLQLG